MATRRDERRATTTQAEPDPSNTDLSSSEDGHSGDEDASPSVEWLVTGRAKRSTAGNRMKSMIAAEEPDDDLELLFAEDEDDAGFTDAGDDASDVHMDSSSDDEDAQENADELDGEKELEKQARESRQAARKRKAQEAIPMKFRKKVKIAPEPNPRPKKKSERISWLPSPADMPTRASKRETTMLSKEQLHQQMIEREVKRLKQVEAMEKKAKKMEALKKPPMTQAQRLAEAAIVEKKNAKSLNHWEEAEKQREEERKAKLAALNNRTLNGPVITFWSGVGEWVDGKLKHIGKIVTIEEKPVRKKRASVVEQEMTGESTSKEGVVSEEPAQSAVGEPADDEPAAALAPTATGTQGPRGNRSDDRVAPATEAVKDAAESEKSAPMTHTMATLAPLPPPTPLPQPPSSSQETIDTHLTAPSPAPIAAPNVAPVSIPSAVSSAAPRHEVPILNQPNPQTQERKATETMLPEAKPPSMLPPTTVGYTTSMFALPSQPPLMKPPELKPPSSSFLAPPAGITQGGLSMPMIGYHTMSNMNKPLAVLAPPNTGQRQSPLSMPQAGSMPQIGASAPSSAPPSAPPSASPPPPSIQPIAKPPSAETPTQTPRRASTKPPLSASKPTKVNAQRQQAKESPPPPPSPPANGKATRNCIILRNFNENAVKEKAVQNQILFGKDMAKLPKPTPAPRCVITNHPARYRDPKTGLPYYNAHAFQEIRKVERGEYKWSRLIEAWVGSGSYAARGVPARFLDPSAPGPPKAETKPSEDPPSDMPAPEPNQGVIGAAPATPVTMTVPVTPKGKPTSLDLAPPTPTATTIVDLPPPPTLTSSFVPVAAPTSIPTSAPASAPALASVATPAPAPTIPAQGEARAPETTPVLTAPSDPAPATTLALATPAAATSTSAITAGDQ
ncbi:YL1-domain-containing protein [Durotheca rogersii]|uniref:YL1-domain-containing protein n=1 Tax=Durotheca rogersii TaxID=419775 RepID=UPI00221E7EB4|nr:YL1-domain-containing protein [Durotheca rogersii]KAI5868041.1 YL1-domain-containing protein [Durotheca rogersii]